jgi:hypothetical protein
MIHRAAGHKSIPEMDAEYEKVADLYREFSPVNHLDASDPPILLRYAGAVDDPQGGIHHSMFGVKFKEKADKVGAVCHIELRKNPGMFPKPPREFDFVVNILKSSE